MRVQNRWNYQQFQREAHLKGVQPAKGSESRIDYLDSLRGLVSLAAGFWRISYNLYPIHMLMIALILPQAIAWMNTSMHVTSPFIVIPVSFFLVLGLTALFSSGFFNAVKQPFFSVGEIGN